MRYDDRLATVLSGADEGARGRIVRWRQVVDLLAQRRVAQDDLAARDAFRWLGETRAEIPLHERMAAARAVAGRPIPIGLLLFFAGDAAVVAAPVVRRARLAAQDWLAILPCLGPTARALLRHREDLPTDVARALRSFGPADLVLDGEEEQTPPPAPAVEPFARAAPPSPARPKPEPAPQAPEKAGPIQHLVERIEAFRRQRDTERVAPAPPSAPPEPAPARVADIEPFRWESGVDGLISWTDAARPGALVGHALGGDDDAPTTRAFSARRPFRDAPAWLPALGPILLSGVPVFEGRSGRFTGYRGVGRPSAPVQAAARSPASPPPPPLAVREMVHELRTPLNAIVGFAEMIAGEYLGPAAPGQRDRAAEIRVQAEQLQHALEDLDLAARLRAGEAGAEACDLQDILVDEHAALETGARARGVLLGFRAEPGLRAAAVPPDAARRLTRRLVGAAVAEAGKGGLVQLAVRNAGAEELALEVTRATDAPADDLALRVARSLAEGAGGALDVQPNRWTARLPAMAPEPAAAPAFAD